MKKEEIEEIIVMLRKQKVFRFELGDLKLEFVAAAFYEDVEPTKPEEKDEDDDEILYHSV